jgi:hypothetical protein
MLWMRIKIDQTEEHRWIRVKMGYTCPLEKQILDPAGLNTPGESCEPFSPQRTQSKLGNP